MEWGGKREKKTGEKLSVTMAAHFLFFFSPAKSASEKCVFFFNGVGCKADMAVLSELLEDSFLCERRDKRANNYRHQFTVNNKSCTRWPNSNHAGVCAGCTKNALFAFLAKNDFLVISRPKCLFSREFVHFCPHVGLSLILIKKWWMKEWN